MKIENFIKMCLTTPFKITKITGKKVEAKGLNKQKITALNLTGKLKVGDFIVIQNNLVIKKVSKRELVQIIKY